MKVSFDFDSCLSTKRMQIVASIFIKTGHDVYVTTTRYPSTPENIAKWPWTESRNLELFKITDGLGIPRKNITFTSMIDKWNVLHEFDIHYDDDDNEKPAVATGRDAAADIPGGRGAPSPAAITTNSRDAAGQSSLVTMARTTAESGGGRQPGPNSKYNFNLFL